MAKKILIFSLAYYPSNVSGAETAIKDITDRINPDDVEFHMITHHFDTTQSDLEQIGNVLVHRVGFGSTYLSKILYVPLATLKGILLHKKYNYDGLWSIMTYMLFPVVLMRFFGTRIPYVLSLQDGDSFERVFLRWRIKLIFPLLKYGFKNATVIQAISVYLSLWPRKLGYKGKVELIHDGANPESIHHTYTKNEIAELRKDLGGKDDDVLLINTARLVHQKGADTTIRALAFLQPHIKLILVGDGDERKKLEDLVSKLGLTDRVVFTGQVDRTVVTKYRLASDIFVGPSRSEGLGHAFLSAMACHLPVITTQVGGIVDFLFDKERNPDKEPTGWAVDVDSPKQIAKAVEYILSNKDEVRIITDRARKMVEEKYDWDVIARDMKERVFDLIIKKI